MYRIHPQEVHELRDLGQLEKTSANGEDFAREVSGLHEQVKMKLQDSSQKYKQKVDLKRREVEFTVGDQVLAHLCKERFPQATYNKLKFKKIRLCKILCKFSANAYELQLPPDIGISPIFNVADLFPYTSNLEEGSSTQPKWDTQEGSDSWIRKMPTAQPLEIEEILDTQVARWTQREYLQYLIKWKNCPIEDSSWLDVRLIQRAGYSI